MSNFVPAACPGPPLKALKVPVDIVNFTTGCWARQNTQSLHSLSWSIIRARVVDRRLAVATMHGPDLADISEVASPLLGNVHARVSSGETLLQLALENGWVFFLGVF